MNDDVSREPDFLRAMATLRIEEWEFIRCSWNIMISPVIRGDNDDRSTHSGSLDDDGCEPAPEFTSRRLSRRPLVPEAELD